VEKTLFVSSVVTGDIFSCRVRPGEEKTTIIPYTLPVTEEDPNIGYPLPYEQGRKGKVI
jgi:hypothetical protein